MDGSQHTQDAQGGGAAGGFGPFGNGGGAWGQAQFARQMMRRRAGLPVRLGVGTGLVIAVVGMIPFLLVLLAAVLCGFLVYAVASGVARLGAALGLVGSDSTTQANPAATDGRENVRVVERPGP